MKRTTIMIEEEVLYDLQRIAQEKEQSMASVLREALATYITEQRKVAPPRNPLLGLIGIGASAEPTDIADGEDERLLGAEVHPIYGWSTAHEHAG
jgi:metal-responsive CopG/Arc/MetJ family transcriptional regulator